MKSTLFHTLEIAVILGVVYGVQQLFQVSNELILGVVIVCLSGLAKYARAEGPVVDYVNGK